MKLLIAISLLTILILTACGNRYDPSDKWFGGTGTGLPADVPGPPPILPIPPSPVPVNAEARECSGLTGDLHIFSPGTHERSIRFYIAQFTYLHPNVNITVEAPDEDEHWHVASMGDQMALNTRLMTTPADIFIPPGGANFEKMAMDGLFVDLNSFIRGPRGIDLDNYFTNVLEAARQQGGLFIVPLHVSPFDAMLALNIEMFESIGIDAREIEAVTIDQLLAYYLLIREANPAANIVLSDRFSLMYLLTESAVYDVDTLTVNVNTPEMTARFRQAMDMRMGMDVFFNPNNWESVVHMFGLGHSVRFLNLSHAVYTASFHAFNDLALFFAAGHPHMQFTPVRRTSSDGYVRFETSFLPYNFAIMQGSANQDLAWEFIRFMLEFDEIRPRAPGTLAVSTAFPVNRARFNVQVHNYISINYRDIAEVMNLDAIIDVGETHREDSIAAAFEFFYDMMNSFNRQVRHSDAVFNSLVYPDIWLLHTGRQTVEQALASIQNRLELYVHE